MPFPWGPAPTLGEFLADLCNEHGCVVASVRLVRDDGEDLTCVLRTLGDVRFRTFIDLREVEERLSPGQIRGICRNLRIDPAAFGYRI